jgi:hypothetical protein
MSALGQSRPNSAFAFESALASTSDISLLALSGALGQNAKFHTDQSNDRLVAKPVSKSTAGYKQILGVVNEVEASARDQNCFTIRSSVLKL